MKLTNGRFQTVASFVTLFSVLSVSGPAMARGGGCPAFTSAMVDAAWLAIDYSQPEPPFGGAIDNPSEPRIGCQLTNDAGNVFTVGVDDGVAGVEGRSNQFDTPTLLRTRIENLTKGEAHACRAQILASFVWSQYCEPLLVD